MHRVLPALYGTQMAALLACDLAVRGMVIVSGLVGIDAITSGTDARSALFGTGIDVCYPQGKQKAFRKSVGAWNGLD
jgi:predicted Rossmann fold nucleotide-binding protein DprA/Smf involved in DNA uptake